MAKGFVSSLNLMQNTVVKRYVLHVFVCLLPAAAKLMTPTRDTAATFGMMFSSASAVSVLTLLYSERVKHTSGLKLYVLYNCAEVTDADSPNTQMSEARI